MRRGARGNPVSFFSFQDIMVCTIGVVILVTLLLILRIGAEAAAASAALRQEDGERERTSAIEAADAEAAELRRRLASLEAAAAADPNERLARQRATLRELDRELRQLREEAEAAELALAEAVRGADLDATSAIAEELLRRRDQLAEEVAAIERRQRIVYLLARDEAFPPTVAELSAERVVVSFDQAAEASFALAASDPRETATRLLELFRSRPDWRQRTLLVVLKPSGLPLYAALRELVAADPRFEEVSIGLDLIGESQWTSDAFPSPRAAEEDSP